MVYVKPFKNHIPRDIRINDTLVNIYYKDQVIPKPPMLCTNCFEIDHFKSKCVNDKKCRKCRKNDHIDDSECEAQLSKPNTNILPFAGDNDILSNFYSCSINMHGFTSNSVEQTYQYVKAMRSSNPNMIERIKSAPNAQLAKRYSREIPYNPYWENEKVDVMKEIIREKVKQVPEFRNELVQSKNQTIVESVRGDFFWSSALSKDEVVMTKQKYWPGENMMGTILMDVRAEILNEEVTPKKSKKKKKKDEESS